MGPRSARRIRRVSGPGFARRVAMIAIDTMRANVFHAPQEFKVEEVARPRPGAGEALIRVTMTTICGTDVHIVKGEYPVRPGLVLGHEPVGVIEELGPGVTGYEIGERVLVGAITPCGQCHACLAGHLSQCGHGDGLRGDRRLALRQHDRRRAGRIPARAVRAGEPRQDPRRRDRRAGRPAGRHRLDRLRRRGVGWRADRRHGRRVRPGPDRPVRDGRRQADGRGPGHRRRQRPGPTRDGEADGRRRRRSTSPRSTSSTRSSG